MPTIADMKIAWFALAVIALLLLAVLGRYEIIDTAYESDGATFKFDRWTGQTRVWMVLSNSVGWSQAIGNYKPPAEALNVHDLDLSTAEPAPQ